MTNTTDDYTVDQMTEIVRAAYVDPTPWANSDIAGEQFDAWLSSCRGDVRNETLAELARIYDGPGTFEQRVAAILSVIWGERVSA